MKSLTLNNLALPLTLLATAAMMGEAHARLACGLSHSQNPSVRPSVVLPIGITKAAPKPKGQRYLYNHGAFSIQYGVRDRNGREVKRTLHHGTTRLPLANLTTLKCLDHTILNGKPVDFAKRMRWSGATVEEQMAQLSSRAKLADRPCDLQNALIDAGNPPAQVSRAMNSRPPTAKKCVVRSRNTAGNALKDLKVQLNVSGSGANGPFSLSARLNKQPPRGGYAFEFLVLAVNGNGSPIPPSSVGLSPSGGAWRLEGNYAVNRGTTTARQFSGGSVFAAVVGPEPIYAIVAVYPRGNASAQDAWRNYRNSLANSPRPQTRFNAHFAAHSVRVR